MASLFRISIVSAALALITGTALLVLGTPPPGLALAGLAVTLGGLIALYAAWAWQAEQLRNLKRLHAEVMVAAPGNPSLSRRWFDGETGDGIGDLARSIADLLAVTGELGRQPDRRLEAVIKCLDRGVMVITGDGLVSLINASAAAVLGSRRARVGTSVFSAVSRIDVLAAMYQARRADGCVTARIGLIRGGVLDVRVGPIAGHRGAVLVFDADQPVFAGAALSHDLSLHDEPPPALVPGDDTRLDALPWLCLDTETTGLNVTADRIVSLAAVPGHGLRLYGHLACDELVNPGIAIPPRATAIHGLTDDMLVGAGNFSDAMGRLSEMMVGRVVIGHNIGFDLALLEAECRRHGLDWAIPPHLDTCALAMYLIPDAPGYSLDALADLLGLEIRGRHTALGDSLVTCGLYLRLVPRLAAAGKVTLGEARAIGERYRKLDQRAGWRKG